MPTPRILLCTLGASAVFLLTACSNPDSHATLSAQTAAKVGNPITGEGLPNPAPKVTRNWGELPAGRKWGTSAGVDIDPKDGHVWAYERCGAGAAGGPGGGEDPLLAMSDEIAIGHHERWNGGGYPKRLAGEAIALSARIIAVADVYDALTSARVYKSALGHEDALRIIREGRGTQFDPAVVDAFERVEVRFDEVRRRHHGGKVSG